MKGNNALWNLFAERQSKKNFLRNSLMNQFWKILKAESYVIVRVTNKSASFATQLFQQGQPFVDKRFTNALFLIFWQYRNRTQAVPVVSFLMII
jgi:hypothetical protein